MLKLQFFDGILVMKTQTVEKYSGIKCSGKPFANV